jgi:very-short-patch-repair endonuclease
MIQGLWPLVTIIIICVITITALKIFLGRNKDGTEDYPYEKQQILFTPAERSFFGVLEQAVDGKLRIMGKVRLADVVKVKNGNSKSARQKALNKIQSKHVDFVACDMATLGVKFVVELDDKSHNQPKRQERDEFVDKALSAAKIPVFHFAVKRTYTIQELQNSLFGNKSEAINNK